MKIWKFYFDNFDDAYNYYCERLDDFFATYGSMYFSPDAPANTGAKLAEIRPQFRREDENKYEVTALAAADDWELTEVFNAPGWHGLIAIIDHEGIEISQA